MKKPVFTTIALAALIFTSTPVHALRALIATILEGEIHVIGIQANRGASINWEGGIVAKANNGGAFQFSTTILPQDCVGTLSDGVTTISVVVNGCVIKQVIGSGVLKTGQITCNDRNGVAIACVSTGQDGDLQRGLPRNYTSNADGTILDNSTGLSWEKLTDDGTIHDKDNFYLWDEAYAKIRQLNSTNFAGHNDWRLPNINELLTLIDWGSPTSPTVAVNFNDPQNNSFTNILPFPTLSSTTFPFGPGSVWVVDFGVATVERSAKDQRFFVRAVRGGS